MRAGWSSPYGQVQESAATKKTVNSGIVLSIVREAQEMLEYRKWSDSLIQEAVFDI